jgi:DNA-binding NarL/FixJ family response regulator
VLDLHEPAAEAFTDGRRLMELVPAAKLVFLARSEDPDLAAEAFRIGASRYLLKQRSASEFLHAIAEVSNGQTYVTPLVTTGLVGSLLRQGPSRTKPVTLSVRQKAMLRLLVEGLTMQEIGHALSISARTVAFHKYGTMHALGLGTGAELIQYAVTHQTTLCPVAL